MPDMTEQTPAVGKSRTPLLMAVVAAAAVVAGVLGFFVVLPLVAPDDSTTATTATAPRTVSPTATPSASPSATALPEEFTGTQGRDPFKAQVATGSATSASTTAPTTGTTTAAAAPATPQRLDVLRVDGSPAAVTIRLDTAVHVAGAGETVNGVLKVVSVSAQNDCATFLFGEQSFRMCAKDPARTLS
jgi:hypothetical protein